MTAADAVPLRLLDIDGADAIRLVLQRAPFEESAISKRLQIANLAAVDHPVLMALQDRLAGGGLLEALASLFLFGNVLPRTALRAHLSAAELDAFVACDLLRPYTASGAAPDQVYSPVRLAPIRVAGLGDRDLLVAGDRNDHPDGSPFAGFADIVFPGHNPLTRRFLTLLPLTRPASVLELCAGSGVAALAMAAAGSRCVAADIAERSTHFARFNAWLNDSANFAAACGDLYAPVNGRFDCILAHPPYVPALEHRLTYRDGGESGEEIIRRIVEGLPDHLSVGGTFYMLSLGMDTAQERFEDRLRAWLGPSANEFDIVFALDSITPPEQVASRLAEPFGKVRGQLVRWRDLFHRLQVKEFVYGAVVIRRIDPSAGPAFTRRVLMTDDTSASSFAVLLRWFDWVREPGGEARLLDAKLVVAPGLRLEVHHRMENGAFTPDVFFLENDGRPFRARLKIDAWLAAVLTGLDGRRTVREIFSNLKAGGRTPEGVGDDDLRQLMSFLAERNCVAFGETPEARPEPR